MGLLRFNYRSQAIGHYVDITVAYPTDEYSYFDESRPRQHHHTVPGAGKRRPMSPV